MTVLDLCAAPGNKTAQALAAGGKVVAFESYTKDDKDFSSQLTLIKAAAPDVLFLPNYYNEVPLQAQQARPPKAVGTPPSTARI